MDDDLFNYLVATDQLDEFLCYELPNSIKLEIKKLATDYINGLADDNDVQYALMEIGKSSSINYDLLYKYFNKKLDNL